MTKKHIHILARAIILKDEKILFAKTLNLVENFYFLPGGHIEDNETPESALIRELEEEIGIKFKIIRFLVGFEYKFTPIKNQKICHTHEYNLIYEVENTNITTNKNPKKIEENIEMFWIEFKKLNEINLKPESLKYILSNLNLI